MTGETYSVAGIAIPEELDRLHGLFEQVSQEHPDVAPSDLQLFETAVVEIVGNVVEHGRPQGRVAWTFDLAVRPEELTAHLSDSGQEYVGDLSADMPDPTAQSGRGLPLARAILDGLDYSRDAGANHWTMVRTRGGAT